MSNAVRGGARFFCSGCAQKCLTKYKYYIWLRWSILYKCIMRPCRSHVWIIKFFFAVFTRESVAPSGTSRPISFSKTGDTVYIIVVKLALKLSRTVKVFFPSPTLKCLSFSPHLQKLVSLQFLLCVVFVKIIANRLLCGTAIKYTAGPRAL